VPGVLVLAESDPAITGFQEPGIEIELGVPSTEAVVDAELVIVWGPFGDSNRTKQIAGVLGLAAERGPTIVVMYPGTLSQEFEIVDQLLRVRRSDVEDQPVRPVHPAFREYLSVFGRSSQAFTDPTAEAEVLGDVIVTETAPPNRAPAAMCRTLGEGGAVYVLPYLLAGAGDFVPKLLQALRNHRSGAGGGVPGYLSDLRLGTEAELLANIELAKTDLEGLQKEADRLARFRLLVGPLSGDAFEALAIEALNEVFEGTTYEAEDREDLRVEDFWVVADGEDQALGEAKGQGSHIGRGDVNQVDNHRAEQNRQVEELPGLLVVNIFRGDESLEKRLLPVSEDVVRHAVRQNVLVLRSIDLYRLLSRKFSGEQVGDTLVDALNAGGGWLMVEDEAVELRQG
jgi:hypothetical protein